MFQEVFYTINQPSYIQFKPMKILVTGGSGFVGRNLVKALNTRLR
jgi:hypothetical protein